MEEEDRKLLRSKEATLQRCHLFKADHQRKVSLRIKELKMAKLHMFTKVACACDEMRGIDKVEPIY